MCDMGEGVTEKDSQASNPRNEADSTALEKVRGSLSEGTHTGM